MIKVSLAVLISTLALALINPARSQPNDGFVGVYSDSLGESQCADIPVGTAKTLFIVAKTSGDAFEGVTGVEFRIEVTNKTGWLFTNPAWATDVAFGDVFGPGINAAFSSCRVAGQDSTLLLGTFFAYNIAADSTNLIVTSRSDPSNPNYPCALFTLCDSTLSKRCMSQSTDTPCSVSGKSRLSVQRQFAGSVISAATLNGQASSSNAGIPNAQYIETMTISGWLSVTSPWSPSAGKLVYQGTDRALYVIDMSAAEPSSVQLLVSGSRYTAWSPDGSWVLCLTQTQEQLRRTLGSLIAIPALGGTPVSLVQDADVGSFTWAGDGNIYYWEKTKGRRRTLLPPSAWQGSPPLSDKPYLFLNDKNVTCFEVAPQVEETALTGLVGSTFHTAIGRATFPDGLKHLLSVFDKQRGVYSAVVDLSGNLLVDLGDHYGPLGFAAHSISSDGSHISGNSVVDDGHKVLSAQLFVADFGGSWRVPILPVVDGLRPSFSAIDNSFAFDDPFAEVIHVGSLFISY